MSENSNRTHQCPRCNTAIRTIEKIESCRIGSCNKIDSKKNRINDPCSVCEQSLVNVDQGSLVQIKMIGFIRNRPRFQEIHKCVNCFSIFGFDNQEDSYSTFLV